MSSVAIMRWAREQRVGHHIAKTVLFVLASHADKDGYCKPSYRLIAEEGEVSEATVRRHVPALIEQGLVEVTPGAGRGPNHYRLALSVRRLGDAQGRSASATSRDAQLTFDSASPEGRTTAPVSASSESRSASSGSRSASCRSSDQQKRGIEVTTEVTTEEAPSSPPAREARERAHARGGGGERVPAAELNRTATGGRAFVIVSAWAEHQPGLTTSARRNLSRAVDQLLAQRADAALIPEALDHAHSGPFRNPVAALPYAYEDVRRAHRPPPPTTAVQLAASNGRVPTTTQRVNGALAHLDPEEP